MSLALAALLLLPFIAALTSWRVRGRPSAGLPIAVISVQAVLALALLAVAVLGPSTAFAAPWARAVGLTLAFRADVLGAAFSMALLVAAALTLRRGEGAGEDAGQVAAPFALLQLGFAHAFILADNLLLAAACAVLGSLATFALDRRGAASDEGHAAFDLIAATTGALALVAGALLVADVAGGGAWSSVGVALATWQGEPLGAITVGLFAVAAWTRAARWPWAALSARTGAADRGGALALLCGTYLVARLLPLVSPAPLRAALFAGLPVAALLLALLARALRAEPEP